MSDVDDLLCRGAGRSESPAVNRDPESNAPLHWPAIAPLASLTALSGLATDLRLPAVVRLPAALRTDIVQAQATLSAFASRPGRAGPPARTEIT